MDRVRTFGHAASGGVVAIATILAVAVSRSGDDFGPPDLLPRPIVIGLLLAVPAVVGGVGVLRRDRALLLAAAVACLLPAPLSVATLPLVFPALMFMVAAGSTTARVRGSTWLVAAAVVALVLGSFVSVLATTETQCWLAYETPNGLVYRSASEAETQGPMGGVGGPVGSGCDNGALTVRGVGLAAVLGLGAVALAIAAPKPRPVAA